MRLTGIGTAAVALALAAPPAAHAATWTVEAGGGGCGDGDPSCGSLAAAAGAADHDDEVLVRPGDWGGATFGQGGLTLRGDGAGEARINGSLEFTGDDEGVDDDVFVLQRLTVRATGGHAVHFRTGAAARPKVVRLESLILSGAGAGGAGLAGTTETLSVNPIGITARHVTIADSESAPAYREVENGAGGVATTFHDSIVKGDATGASPGTNNDTSTDNGALFANPGGEDFHLRWNSPAIDQGGGQGGGEIATDVDDEGRTGAWDRGADEFVNYAPAKLAIGPTNFSPRTGEAVGFFAGGAADPNSVHGDGVVAYRWSFGDGTSAQTADAVAAHAYGAAGGYQATVRAVDRLGSEGPPSDPVTIAVSDPPPDPAGPTGGLTSLAQLPGFESGIAAARRGPDVAPPFVSFASPRRGQRIRLRGRRRVPMLRGRTADPSGVRRVELALMRRQGRRCRWFDGRRAFRLGRCTGPRWFKAVLDDFRWRYRFPRRVRPRPAAYLAFVRAVDYRGNASAGAAAGVAFRYAR